MTPAVAATRFAVSGHEDVAKGSDSSGYECTGSQTELFNNWNGGAVSNGGTPPTFSTGGKRYCLVQLDTYHWNGGNGASPAGTITIVGQGGTLGPFQAKATPGTGGALVNWVADVATSPPVVLDGQYQVEDSEPSTWSQDGGSGGLGFTQVWVTDAVPVANETTTTTTPHTTSETSTSTTSTTLPETIRSTSTSTTTTTCAKTSSKIDPATLEFSTHILKRWSDPQRIVVTNTGCTVLHISRQQFQSDSNHAVFTFKSPDLDTCLGATLQPDGTCFVDVTFKADAYGDYKGSVSFTDNGGTEQATFTGSAKPFPTSAPPKIQVKYTPKEKDDWKFYQHVHAFSGIALGVIAALLFEVPPAAAAVAFAAGGQATEAELCSIYADDPPDMHFEVVAVPRMPALPRLPASVTSLSPAVHGLLVNVATFRATSLALNTALERAQGAAAKHDAKAEHQQLEAVKKYALEIASLEDAQPALEEAIVAAVQRSGAHVSFTAAQVTAEAKDLAAKGFPVSTQADFKEAGLRPGQIASMARDAATVHGAMSLSAAMSTTYGPERQEAALQRSLAGSEP